MHDGSELRHYAGMSTMMMFDDEEDDGTQLKPPTPPVRLMIQGLANAADCVLFSTGATASGPNSSASVAGAARLLRLMLIEGGNGASQLALRAKVRRAPTAVAAARRRPSGRCWSALHWIEASLGVAEENTDGGGATDNERAEAGLALLALLSVWLHDCPMAVEGAFPQNLFLVEYARMPPPPAMNGAADSPRSLLHAMSIFVLGICLEETLSGERERAAAREKAKAKRRANAKAARRLQRRVAKAQEKAAVLEARKKEKTEARANRRAARLAGSSLKRSASSRHRRNNNSGWRWWWWCFTTSRVW